MISPTDTFDLIVGGGGNAGLAAAVTACERNKKVLVIVKDNVWERGGHSRYSECMMVSHRKNWHGLSGLDEGEYFEMIMKSSNGHADPTLLKEFVQRSREYPEFAQRHGIKWQEDLNVREKSRELTILGGGQGMLNHYYEWLEKNHQNCKVMYNTEVFKIDSEGGAFHSVEAFRNGRERVRFSGENIVIATGGYEGNSELMKKIWKEKFDMLRFRGPKGNTGIPIFSMISNGAESVGEIDEGIHPIVDARVPQYDGGVIARDSSIPYSVVVNGQSDRIFDEGIYGEGAHEVSYTKTLLEQSNGAVYSIFDKKVWGLFKPHAYPVIKGETISELATRLGLDPQKLSKTIKEFNDSIEEGRQGTTHVLPPKSVNARPINTPPFMAYPLLPGVSFTRFGLKVDSRARVIMKNGTHYDGVYAAGTTMVGNVLTRDEYLGCFDIPFGGIFGIIAGEDI